MKNFFVGLLAVCAIGMAYISWRSIQDDEDAQAAVDHRANAVKARLKQIAVIEEEYKKQNAEQYYCEDLDSLIDFVNNGKLPVVLEEGVLTEKQMDDGWTDETAAALVHSGNMDAIRAAGLENFRRDTTWISIADSLRKYKDGDKFIFGPDFDFSKIKFIPYSGEEHTADGSVPFDMQVFPDQTRSGSFICTMEARAPYTEFLSGISAAGDRKLKYELEKAEARGNYEGLKIGGIGNDNWNNNAGNWD